MFPFFSRDIYITLFRAVKAQEKVQFCPYFSEAGGLANFFSQDSTLVTLKI
jgi:hypothetical protein